MPSNRDELMVWYNSTAVEQAILKIAGTGEGTYCLDLVGDIGADSLLQGKEMTHMEMAQILPELRKLKRVEKLYVMQFLVSELAQEESELIRPDASYPIWSPYDAFDAAETMLKVLQESKPEDYA